MIYIDKYISRLPTSATWPVSNSKLVKHCKTHDILVCNKLKDSHFYDQPKINNPSYS